MTQDVYHLNITKIPQDNKFYVYDLETFPNCFIYIGKFLGIPGDFVFEISDRMDQRNELLSHLSYLKSIYTFMLGFNNAGFDCPIIEELMANPWNFSALKAHQLGTEIIQTQRAMKGRSRVPHSRRTIPQIDLLKINHFDNPAKSTSLKALQFVMRSDSVEDLPFELKNLDDQEKDDLKSYGLHDLYETEKFALKNLHLIKIRQDFLDNGTLKGDVLNFSDTKIGTEYLIEKIGRAKCKRGSKSIQTIRHSVPFKHIILPKIQFKTEKFNHVKNWFSEQTVYIETGNKPKLQADLAGLQFHFGLGGVHASVNDRHFKSNDRYKIIDIDVAGMYVAVAIANGFAPAHLGPAFSAAYKQIQADRKRYEKGTSMNAVLKLAGNSVYGNSNNVYSCFYDPQYTFSVTVNGQLQLIQLVELLSLIPGLKMIQANTDGITAAVPRELEYLFSFWCDEWEKMTGLVLEHVEYSDMWIRDVNNYVAKGVDGKIKRKGAYWYPESEKDYEGNWHKNLSNLAAPKAVSIGMQHGLKAAQAVRLVTDPFDFMLRYKATGQSKIYIGEKKMLKTTRYYVTTDGQPMKKIAPPKGVIGDFVRKNKLADEYYNKIKSEIPPGTWDERINTKNKSIYEMRDTSIESGFLVTECNKASDFKWSNVDWNYYAKEAEKLMIGENHG